MTNTRKNEIVDSIMALLIELTETEDVPVTKEKPVQMLTIRECTEIVRGLKEHTVRQLIAQGKVKYIRTGQGNRGKILVNKEDLLNYFA